MKQKHRIIVTAAASALALSVVAQNTPNPGTDRPEHTRPDMAQPQANRLNGAAKASDVIGMAVKNYQDEKLGTVEDLAVDVESGRIVQVVLSTGGFIGLGETLVAVPPGALHHDVAKKVVHLDADKEKLTSAPRFEMSKWAEFSDAEHLSKVYRHYGEEPAFTFVQAGDSAPDSRRNTDVPRNTDGQRTTDGSANAASDRKSDGAWNKDRMANHDQSMIPASRLGQVQRVSKLMGRPVRNLQSEELGKVENILVDLSSGRIVAVVVSSGGFLGMGDELSAVPPTALRFAANQDSLQLDASKEMLGKAPHFKASQWPDFGQPSYAEGVYRAYRVEPYFTTNAATSADNAARNVRDRGDRTLTPLDQGNSKADVDTTAQIRREITAGKNMSVNARNVKIMTIDGRVTLRGPVNTAEEKRLIEEIAERVARSGNVDNQLEVKLTTSSNN